jgi:hypothetical protein
MTEEADMSKGIPAYVYGQKKYKPDKHCKICGKPIFYGQNGAQMYDCCFECYRPTYHCSPTPVRREADWDELDALEGRCLGDDVD